MTTLSNLYPGIKGAQGVQGITGSQGVQGITGSQGIQGGETKGFSVTEVNGPYSLQTSDVGNLIKINSGISTISISSETFSFGNSFMIYNGTSDAQTISQGVGVSFYSGDGTAISGSKIINENGLATILCSSNNDEFIGVNLTPYTGVEFLSSEVVFVNSSSRTFSNQNIGEPNSNRIIVIAASCYGGAANPLSVASVTVGGVNATVAASKQGSYYSSAAIFYVSLDDSYGDTADVVVNCSTSSGSFSCSIWSLYGNYGLIDSETSGPTSGSGVEAMSTTVDTPLNSIVISITSNFGSDDVLVQIGGTNVIEDSRGFTTNGSNDSTIEVGRIINPNGTTTTITGGTGRAMATAVFQLL